jgi:uncharacterized protein
MAAGSTQSQPRMKALIDINHPAHAHFFRVPIEILKHHGWDVVVTSRDKEMTCELLAASGVRHECLSAASGGGIVGLGRELLQRDYRLWRLVRRERPQVLTAIGGTFVAHVGVLSRTPSLVFYDTENARMQNAITYPFVHRLCVPECYEGWVPRGVTERYAGYHELSYLHPEHFTPDRGIAEANGLDPGRPTFFIRVVAWTANHDIAEQGWTEALLRSVVERLEQQGRVLISSERPLPAELMSRHYAGRREEVHHVLAFCRGFIGESATMASECAVLGVPAVYAANTGRGYTNEQESRYGLVRNVRKLDAASIEAAVGWLLATEPEDMRMRRVRLLTEKLDVAAYAAGQIAAMAGTRLPALQQSGG